ncbi:MAG: anti-sigma factor [Oscillospiraceae bacterium]|jgi:stage II sporulation protein AB (anti-sigma F factor)|nr:anti-sigma factor [Oscillospiraceae bacterium]
MKVLNEMKITFPSKSVNEGYARLAVAAFASQLDPPVDELADVKTAVSEAVTNCIVHAYPDRVGKIEICARIFEGGEFYVKVKDWGCGIEDVKKAMEPLFTTCKNGERAGLGFAVMESFMDKLSVRSKVGKGTCVVMKKKFSQRG